MSKLVTRRMLIGGASAVLLLAVLAFNAAGASEKNRPAEADKVHVVLLVAGADSDIGNADLKDVAAMKHTVKTAFQKDPKRLVIHDLTGKNPKTGKFYTPDEIKGHLKQMKVGKNDNVLVYHSGHGTILDKKRPEATHMLTVDGGVIGRKTIMDTVLAHQPRAVIILTDCCSSYPDARSELEVPDAPELNVVTVRGLLLKPAGVVSITAAEDGNTAEASYRGPNPGRAGSAFTVALLRLCYRDDVNVARWEQLFPLLRQETGAASNGRHHARAFQIKE
jgi:hypothetical protein